MLLRIAALGALLAALPAAAQQPDGPDDDLSQSDCFKKDDSGVFQTCFDPGQGLELGAGAASRFVDAPGSGTTLLLRGGILLRTSRESRSRRGTLWFFEQRFFMTTLQPLPDLRELTVTAYEGTFRRHLREGFILVPTPRPLRLPFPFDIALHARVATFERRVFDGPGARFEVGRAALMLDPIRSPSGRVRLAVGPALSYTIRARGEEWVHELSPFTSAMLDFGLESDDGWWSARLAGIGGWVTIPGQGTFFRASGELQAERVLIAINDQPVWLSLGAKAANRDAGVYRETEVVASLSLVMRAFQ